MQTQSLILLVLPAVHTLMRSRNYDIYSLTKGSGPDIAGSDNDYHWAEDLYKALGREVDYIRAVQELAGFLPLVYATTSKATKDLLLEAVKRAIRQCTGIAYEQKALAGLVSETKAALPKSRREAVLREYKQAGIDLQRRLNKELRRPQECLINRLPQDVLLRIFQHLDPYSLARAALVSPAWAGLCPADQLWQKFFIAPASDCARKFRGDRRLKQRWQSRRVLTHGRLAWISTDPDDPDDAHCQLPTVQRAVAIMAGKGDPWHSSDGSESESDYDESRYPWAKLWQIPQAVARHSVVEKH